jgi:hypothetical protein
MANVFPPLSSGIDHDRRSLGAASKAARSPASAKSACEEIARNIAVAHKPED